MRLRVFTLTWLSYAAFYLTRKNFSVVKSRLHDTLGVSVAALGAMDTLYLSLYALGQFVSGGLGDRFGSKKILVVGMLGSATCAICFGLSTSIWLLAITFGLNGIFQATGWPNTVKVMAAWFDAKGRGRIMGLWSTNYQVGGLIATALATYLLVHYGWESAFFVPAAMVGAVGVLLLFLLPREIPQPPLEKGERTEEKRARSSILRMPEVWCLSVSYFGIKLIRYSLLFWLPFYLNHALSYSEGMSGYLSISLEVGGTLGAIAIGWLSDRYFSKERAILLVPMLLLLALAFLAYRQLGASGAIANVCLMSLIGFFIFGPDTLISGACAQDIGGEKNTGAVAGFINGIGSIGAILQGVITAGISQAWGWDALFQCFTVIAVLSALCLVPLAMKQRLSARRQLQSAALG